MSAHLIGQRIYDMPPTDSRIIHPGPVVIPVEAHFILELFAVVEVLIAEISLRFLIMCQAEGGGAKLGLAPGKAKLEIDRIGS